jgi:hypothetical protein
LINFIAPLDNLEAVEDKENIINNLFGKKAKNIEENGEKKKLVG